MTKNKQGKDFVNVNSANVRFKTIKLQEVVNKTRNASYVFIIPAKHFLNSSCQ